MKVASIECGAVSISQIPPAEHREGQECSCLDKRIVDHATETVTLLRTRKGANLSRSNHGDDGNWNRGGCIADIGPGTSDLRKDVERVPHDWKWSFHC